jgi:hypothetical protein
MLTPRGPLFESQPSEACALGVEASAMLAVMATAIPRCISFANGPRTVRRFGWPDFHTGGLGGSFGPWIGAGRSRFQTGSGVFVGICVPSLRFFCARAQTASVRHRDGHARSRSEQF